MLKTKSNYMIFSLSDVGNFFYYYCRPLDHRFAYASVWGVIKIPLLLILSLDCVIQGFLDCFVVTVLRSGGFGEDMVGKGLIFNL